MPIRPILAVTALATGLVVFLPSANADDEENTAQFVARCSANPHSCQEDVGLGIVMGLTGPCVPNGMMEASDAQILQVTGWLSAHPDVHPNEPGEAIDAALDALYPCAN
jgi:hypothetical protein